MDRVVLLFWHWFLLFFSLTFGSNFDLEPKSKLVINTTHSFTKYFFFFQLWFGSKNKNLQDYASFGPWYKDAESERSPKSNKVFIAVDHLPFGSNKAYQIFFFEKNVFLGLHYSEEGSYQMKRE